LPVDPEHLQVVREGMHGGDEPGGTAYWRAHIEGVESAGKTGTVQVVGGLTTDNDAPYPWKLRDHGWFASFAPIEEPELVVVVFAEHGGGGSLAAAPIAKQVYEEYFDIRAKRQAEARGPSLSVGEDRPALSQPLRARLGLPGCRRCCSPGSASPPSAAPAPRWPIDYLTRQGLGGVGFGIAMFLLAFTVNYHRWSTSSLILYLVGIALLVLVLFFGRARRRPRLVRGRRLRRPAGRARQAGPILFLARYLAGVKRRHLGLKQIAVSTPSSSCRWPSWRCSPTSARRRCTCRCSAPCCWSPASAGRCWWWPPARRAAGAGLWTFGMHDYQRERVYTFLNPQADPLGAGYQVQQSKIAVGSGELLGKGYGQGTQSQLRFLPAVTPTSSSPCSPRSGDFVGTITVLALYAVFLLNGLRIAIRARERAAILLVVGLSAWSPSTSSTTPRWSSASCRSPASRCPSSPTAARSPCSTSPSSGWYWGWTCGATPTPEAARRRVGRLHTVRLFSSARFSSIVGDSSSLFRPDLRLRMPSPMPRPIWGSLVAPKRSTRMRKMTKSSWTPRVPIASIMVGAPKSGTSSGRRTREDGF
jgi:hypothetical protein